MKLKRSVRNRNERTRRLQNFNISIDCIKERMATMIRQHTTVKDVMTLKESCINLKESCERKHFGLI